MSAPAAAGGGDGGGRGFGVVLVLGPADLPVGTDPAALLERLRAALAALPGAVAVAVGRQDAGPGADHADGRATGRRRLEVFPAVRPAPGAGPPEAWPSEAWTAVRAAVRATVRTVLDDPGGNGAPPGMADAQGFLLALSPAGGKVPEPAPALPPVTADPLAALDDAALAAVLLDLAAPWRAPPGLAARLVARFGGFAAALAAPERELRAVEGLDTHAVVALKLVHEAALRLARAAVAGRPVLDDDARLLAYLSAVVARERVEQFRILFLDADHRLLADEAQARGTVNHTPVYPREVVRRAVELGAAALILVHNHPSGDPTPSREDLAMTARVRETAALLGVALQDHVIVGNGRWTSFRREGLL